MEIYAGTDQDPPVYPIPGPEAFRKKDGSGSTRENPHRERMGIRRVRLAQLRRAVTS